MSARPLPRLTEPSLPAWPWPVLALLYGTAWLLLEQLSQVLWFLPAGLRLAALWLTPTRRWGWLAGAEWLALGVKTLYQGLPLLSITFLALDIAPWLLYATVVVLLRGAEAHNTIDSPRRMIGLLGAGALAAAAVSPILAAYFAVPGEAPLNSLAGAFAFLYGDLLGQLVLAPLLIAIARAPRRMASRPSLWIDLALVISAAVGVFVLLRERAELVPFVLPLAFAPLFYLGFRQGWEGAALAVTVVGVLIQAFVEYGLLPVQVEPLQLVLAVVGSGALVLGAASTALRHSHDALTQRHRELAVKNEETAALADELRSISQRLVRLEEQGQRELAGELDYQLGQAIHALGTRISLAFRDARDEQSVRLLESLREQVREIQDSLRRALRQLRPAALDSQGLRHALAEGPLRETLEDAGVPFTPSFFGRVDTLSEDARTAIYRICQVLVREAASREVTRAVAIKLDVMPHAIDRLRIELQIDVEHSEFCEIPPPADLSPAVADRVLAQHGHYRVEPQAHGVRHSIVFEADSDGVAD